MGIVLASNFDVNAALPLDSRDTVADNTERDAINAGRRYLGMKVYSVADKKTYVLKDGILNANWKEDGGGGGTIVVADITARNAIVSGDRYDGLSVYALSTKKNYQLQGGITNSDWKDAGGGGGVLSVADYAAVTAIPSGDRALGMIINQQDENVNWQYQGGILDANLVMLNYYHWIHPTALVLASGAAITLQTGVFDTIRTVSSSVTNGGLVTMPTGRRQGEKLGLLGGSDANPASIALAANVALGGADLITLAIDKITSFVWVGTKWIMKD